MATKEYGIEITSGEEPIIEAEYYDDNTIEIEEWETVTTVSKTRAIYGLIETMVALMRQHGITKVEITKEEGI